MADKSHIEWTEATWNPVRVARRSAPAARIVMPSVWRCVSRDGELPLPPGLSRHVHEDVIDLPRTWKTSRRIFVNSMSDLFHPDVPLWFIRRAFKTMAECPQHSFQVLTKRSDRVRDLAAKLPWPKNIWMGVSVEDNRVFSHR